MVRGSGAATVLRVARDRAIAGDQPLAACAGGGAAGTNCPAPPQRLPVPQAAAADGHDQPAAAQPCAQQPRLFFPGREGQGGSSGGGAGGGSRGAHGVAWLCTLAWRSRPLALRAWQIARLYAQPQACRQPVAARGVARMHACMHAPLFWHAMAARSLCSAGGNTPPSPSNMRAASSRDRACRPLLDRADRPATTTQPAAALPGVQAAAAAPASLSDLPAYPPDFVRRRLITFVGIVLGYSCFYLTRNSLTYTAPAMVRRAAAGRVGLGREGLGVAWGAATCDDGRTVPRGGSAWTARVALHHLSDLTATCATCLPLRWPTPPWPSA